jgi:hypothetical protein
MDSKVLDIIKPMFDKKCCRIRVHAYKSLIIGIGEKIFHNDQKLIDAYNGEWEIGTYYCAWRIIKDNLILCGSSDYMDDIPALHRDANKIEFGSLVSMNLISNIDVRLTFDSGIVVDFLATISRDDEYFHIRCPDKASIKLTPGGKWAIGKSDAPWTGGTKIEFA